MLELEIWDRARRAIYALEQEGYDVTPCVEAIVDSMSMPGVTEAWTAPAVERVECVAIVYGSYYANTFCAYPGTARLAAEAFESSEPSTTTTTTTPAPETGDAPSTISTTVTATPAPPLTETPTPSDGDEAGATGADDDDTAGEFGWCLLSIGSILEKIVNEPSPQPPLASVDKYAVNHHTTHW